MPFRGLSIAIVLFGMGVCTNTANACNIPVFRYALERWQADLIEVIIFHNGPLSETDEKLVTSIQSSSRNGGGHANIAVIQRDIHEPLEEDLAELWKQMPILGKPLSKLPIVFVRCRASRGKMVNVWSGPLDRLDEISLLQSPARKELTKRLLWGDSVVWLVINSEDEEQNKTTKEVLLQTLKEVAKEIPIPEGIGLPGSELYAPVPLDIRFSVLEINRNDPNEKLLIDWVAKFRPESFAAGTPLVVPVFGRGRALEILSADLLRPSMVQELCIFLCSACSCQVKDLNPGFDLLLTTDWEHELFGDELPEIPDAPLRQQRPEEAAELVAIPPGIGEAVTPVDTPDDAWETIETQQVPEAEVIIRDDFTGANFSTPTTSFAWLLPAFILAVTLITLLARISP